MSEVSSSPAATGFARSTPITGCRSCASRDLHPVLDLGVTPLADRLVPLDADPAAEPRFPLRVVFCAQCSLVQIDETVAPEILFQDEYPYYSSFSDALLRHSAQNVEELIATRDLGADSFVVEIASNDGYLLRNYVDRGIDVLGVDPAAGPAAAAERVGVPTRVEFFGRELAEQLAGDRRADVIHANNVLAHVADTHSIVAGIAALLAPDGVAVLEVPYVRDLVDHREFDTIYHEHLCYFSVTALDHLFRQHGLYLNDVRRLAIHGGSLRLFVEPTERRTDALQAAIADEHEAGLDRVEYFSGFATAVHDITNELRSQVSARVARGEKLAAYGAAAKGATLLNYTGIGADSIQFVVDRNTHKHGKRMPGVGIPVVPVTSLLDEQPDCTLLLTWNFKDEILTQQAEYRARGGRFLVPIPFPEVV